MVPPKTSIEPSDANTIAAHRHFAVVGMVATSWAGFEAYLDLSALGMGQIPLQAGACLTAQVIGPARKLDAYIALVRLRGGEKFIGELETFGKEATAMGERRNRAVHDPWTIADKKPFRFEITAKRKLRFERVEVSTDKLRKLVAEIQELNARFQLIDEKIKASLAT